MLRLAAHTQLSCRHPVKTADVSDETASDSNGRPVNPAINDAEIRCDAAASYIKHDDLRS